jgi:hypothetical protein
LLAAYSLIPFNTFCNYLEEICPEKFEDDYQGCTVNEPSADDDGAVTKECKALYQDAWKNDGDIPSDYAIYSQTIAAGMLGTVFGAVAFIAMTCAYKNYLKPASPAVHAPLSAAENSQSMFYNTTDDGALNQRLLGVEEAEVASADLLKAGWPPEAHKV